MVAMLIDPSNQSIHPIENNVPDHYYPDLSDELVDAPQMLHKTWINTSSFFGITKVEPNFNTDEIGHDYFHHAISEEILKHIESFWNRCNLTEKRGQSNSVVNQKMVRMISGGDSVGALRVINDELRTRYSQVNCDAYLIVSLEKLCDTLFSHRRWSDVRQTLVTILHMKKINNVEDTTADLLRLGDICRLTGFLSEAKTYYEDCFTIRWCNRVDDHRLAAVLHRLGDLNFMVKAYDKAHRFYKQALRRDLTGSYQIDLIPTILHKVGLCLFLLGYEDDALGLLYEALCMKLDDQCDQVEDNVAPYRLGTIFDELSAYAMQKNIVQITSLHNLAPSIQANRRIKSPVTWRVSFSTPIVTATKMIARIDPKSLRNLFYTADELASFKEERKVKDTASQYKQISKALEIMGNKELSEGKLDTALLFFTRSFRVKTEALGGDHISASDTIEKIAYIFYNKGLYEKALNAYHALLKLRESSLEKDHPSITSACSKIGLTCMKLGKWDEAIMIYERVLEIREGTLGKNHIAMCLLLERIGYLRMKLGDYHKALSNLEAAHRIQILHFDDSNESMALTMNDIGNLLFYIGGKTNRDRAKESYIAALDILSKHHTMTTSVIASIVLNNLGYWFLESGIFHEALKFLRRSLAIVRNVDDVEPSVLICILRNMGDALSLNECFSMADASYREAYELEMKMPDSERVQVHILTSNKMETLDELDIVEL